MAPTLPMRVTCAAIALSAIGFSAHFAQAATPMVSGGGAHAIALHSDGTVRTWGSDVFGQLGIGRPLQSLTPAYIPGLTGVRGISAGTDHAAAFTTDGSLWTWGRNTEGQLGDGTYINKPVPVKVALTGVVAVAAGTLFTVAVRSDGTLWSWGTDGFRNTPERVATTGTMVAVASGGLHSLALRNDGTVWAWGRSNPDGQLGDGTTAIAATWVPKQVAGLTGVTAVGAGDDHSVALKSDGSVWTWGGNAVGQLGDGTTERRLLPVRVSSLPPVSAISTFGGQTSALGLDGTLWIWGVDPAGSGPILTPRAVSTIANVTLVSSGRSHILVRRFDGSVWSWGNNFSGELGNGTTIFGTSPARIASLSGVSALSAGDNFSLAISSDGRVLSWGSDSWGQLGIGATLLSTTPRNVPALGGVSAVAAGEFHSLALRGDGSVAGWGFGGHGQLGSAPTTFIVAPQTIAGLSGIVAIAAGADHTVALNGQGQVMTLGDGYFGQLGDGTTTARNSPAAVAGLGRAVAVAAGFGHTVALLADGTVWAWGHNGNGQLGDGTLVNRLTPVRVSGLGDVIAISAGSLNTLALKRDGTVWAWGYGGGGQLGPAAAPSQLTPVQVTGLSSIVAIAGSGIHLSYPGEFAMALRNDGTVWTWGSNRHGQLGDGTTTSRSMPAPIEGLAMVESISAGTFWAMAVRSDGTVYSWGRNDDGQIGDGTLAIRGRPAVVIREGGSGRVTTGDWYLDLRPTVADSIPAAFAPAFTAVTTGTLSSIVSVSADVRFRSQDAGRELRIFAYAPAPGSTKSSHTCTLAQLSSSGALQSTSASGLQSVGNVTGSLSQTVTVLNNVSSSQVAGATFCVGTGSGTEAVSTANSQCVVTVPGTNVCLPPSGSSSVAANTPGALSGLWWNAAESGWGIHFTQRSNNIFAAWYTYDTSGNPKWYVASNCTGASANSGTCSGTLYEVSGPTFFGTTFNPNLVNVVSAGSLQVSFTNANNASMSYTVAGQSRTVAIVRQPLGSGTIPGVDYTDLWWNPSESGWGMAMAQQGANIFLAWYVYDAAGRPTWYVASNCTVSGAGCTGTLYRTTGPPFGPTFSATAVQVFTAGTVTLTFSDANNGTLSYTVNGVSGSKTITRQVF
jgi:alpha-tubulin suppressor-like RCC1 family protein